MEFLSSKLEYFELSSHENYAELGVQYRLYCVHNRLLNQIK